MKPLPSVLSLLTLFLLPSLVWSQCPNCSDRRTISVNASATVTADADLALVHVGYRLYGVDAKAAYATATETSNAIMRALTGSGIEKTAIESSSQALQPTPSYELQQIPLGSEDRFKRQFTVIQNWTIRVKPDASAKTLDTAIKAGANESGWIQWTVSDESSLSASAAAKALANAHSIAESMVKSSDAHLGHLVSVSQSEAPRPVMSAGPVGGAMGNFLSGQASPTQPLAINSRRIELRSTVFAVYSLE